MTSLTRRFGLVAVIQGLMAGASGQASAALITYTETATGVAGSLNGLTFSNVTLTLTAPNNNTASIVKIPIAFVLTNTSLVGSVSTIPGTFTFTDETQVVCNQFTPAAGFTDGNEHANLLGTIAPTFATYDLSTPIGPVVSASAFFLPVAYSTTSGPLIITSVGGITFQATAAVPEPSSLALCGVAGLAGVGYSRRPRKCAPTA